MHNSLKISSISLGWTLPPTSKVLGSFGRSAQDVKHNGMYKLNPAGAKICLQATAFTFDLSTEALE